MDIVAYDGIATREPMFIAQPLQYPHRSMALLDMDLFVGFQNGTMMPVNPASLGEMASLLRR